MLSYERKIVLIGDLYIGVHGTTCALVRMRRGGCINIMALEDWRISPTLWLSKDGGGSNHKFCELILCKLPESI